MRCNPLSTTQTQLLCNQISLAYLLTISIFAFLQTGQHNMGKGAQIPWTRSCTQPTHPRDIAPHPISHLCSTKVSSTLRCSIPRRWAPLEECFSKSKGAELNYELYYAILLWLRILLLKSPHFVEISTFHGYYPHFVEISTFHRYYPHFVDIYLFCGYYPHFIEISMFHRYYPHFVEISLFRGYYPHFVDITRI